ncbi:MAG: methylenetetrahydrofolate reductase [Pseudomonadota bacterium]|nr:methylenetetrahydrofolate reductase [Pseudomonadota bacterium]
MPLFTDFPFASDLIQLIRKEYGASFFIDVVAYPEMHPESPSLHSDMSNFRTKVESGADRVITQFFFNCDAYFRFLDDCEKYGVDIPVIAGLMPITESKGLRRFSERCGTEIPRWILNRMEHYEEDSSSLQEFGVDVLSRMCSTLIDGGVPGLHFFTLNKTYSVSRICANLGLMD